MKRFLAGFFCIVTLLSCCFFSSCAQKRYSEALTCLDISTALKGKILTEEYAEYSESDARYVFDGGKLFDSCSIIYSTASDDLGEIGILHAPNEDSAKTLLNFANQHIQDEKEMKSEFLKNYLPEEISKFENAEARRYGNYVVYAFLPPESRNEVFDYVEKILRK